jgi:hypothetical protein
MVALEGSGHPAQSAILEGNLVTLIKNLLSVQTNQRALGVQAGN